MNLAGSAKMVPRQPSPLASWAELAPFDHVLLCDALWLELTSVTGKRV